MMRIMDKRAGVRKGKMGQVEMIGLVFIVVIIITATLIYMVYKLNNPSANIKRGYVNRELATNFLISITKTSVKECPQHTLGDLVTDCANTLRRSIFCGGVTSCEMANRTLHDILYETMPELGKDFAFSVNQTDISFAGCQGKDKVQASQVFTLYPGLERVRLTMDVCEI